MTKEIIIILLVIALIYYYRQSKTQTSFISADKSGGDELNQVKQTNSALTSFLKVNSLEELKTKLGEKTLDELIEANEDYETEVDTLTRTKNSLEADLLAQSNAFQNRLREKDREVKKFKEDLKALEKVRGQLNSEKQQHKGSLERIGKLTEQITKLEKKIESLTQDLSKANEKLSVQTFNKGVQTEEGWKYFYHWLGQEVYQLSPEGKIEKIRENELTKIMKQAELSPNSSDQTFLDHLRLTVEGNALPTNLVFPVYQAKWTFEQYFDSDSEPLPKKSKRHQRIKFLFEKWKESLA